MWKKTAPKRSGKKFATAAPRCYNIEHRFAPLPAAMERKAGADGGKAVKETKGAKARGGRKERKERK